MPEQITQKLGFDASTAITSLTNLNRKLAEFRQGLQATSGGLRKFETNATTAVATFNTLGMSATKAAASINTLRVASGGAVPPQIAAQSAAASAAMNTLGTSAATAQTKLKGVSAGATASVAAMRSLTAATNAAAAATTRASASIVSSTGKVTDAMKKAGKAGAAAGKTIGISWKTIGRIILAQGVIRGLSLLVSTFNDAQEAAREFSLRVGEISTISGTALGSINDISNATLELSRNLGIATDEVAEGLYQTLSNQVVEAGEAIRFETTAAKLSITTHSQLKESINALSSVMNSYQLDISEVDEVSAVLFKTIELGRLRMGEFGDVLGRVTPLTAALGISYKEMAASLAALTQKGVPAHTAITQLTAVSQKLLRPTEKLQELYDKWGVETGPQAIERFGGLRGVLLKMRDATAGNDKEFADLLGRVRSMVGAMNLTTDGASALTHALKEMEDPTDDLDAAFERMESTIGRRSVKAWDDLDVSITKFGLSALKVTTPVIEAMATMARNFDLVAAGALGLTAAIVIMKTGMVGAITTTTLLTIATKALAFSLATLFPIALFVAGAVAAVMLGKAIAASFDTASDATARFANSEEAMTKAMEAQSKARIEATKNEVEERRKLITGFVLAEETLIKKSTEIFQINSEAISEVLKDQLSDVASSRAKLIQLVTDAVLGMDDAIRDSEAIVDKTRASLADASFEKSTRSLNENQKAWAALERGAVAASKARAAYTSAGTSELGIKDARELWVLAEKRAKEAVAFAKASDSTVNLFKAEKQLAQLRNSRITSELAFQRDRKALQTDANVLEAKHLKLQEVRINKLKAAQATLIKDSDASGRIKTDERIAADTKAAKALQPLIEKAQEAFNKTDLFKKLGVDGLADKLRVATERAIADADIQFTGAAEKLKAELTSTSYLVNVVLSIDDEAFLESLEAQHGEKSPFDPRRADEVRKVAEKTLADAGEFTEAAAQASVAAVEAINTADAHLKGTVFHNFFDRRMLKMEQVRGIQKKLTSEQALLAIPSEAYRRELEKVVGLLKRARLEGRALTQAELGRVAALKGTGAALEANGDLSNNQLNNSVATVNAIIEGTKQLEKQGKAIKRIPKPSTQEQSKKVLKALEKGAASRAAAEKRVKEQAEGVADATKDTKETSEQLNLVLDAGTTSLSNQADQGERVLTAAEKTLAAEERLVELRRANLQPATATSTEAKPETVTPAVDTSGIEAVGEAVKPLIKGIQDVKRASEDAGNNFGIRMLNGVTQVTEETGILGGAVTALGERFVEVDGKVNTISTSMLTTTGYVEGTTTATWVLNEGMSSVATVAGQTAMQMRRVEQSAIAAARAIAAVAAAKAAAGGAGAAFHGGPAANYMAAGGPTSRGRDTIPIMAAPGEFITNARSSRRFASELQAMNTGREPIFRDKGGSVTNVGDINVSVTQGETAGNTARQIATSLRRELRRGTSRL